LTQTGYCQSKKETLNAVKRVEAAGSEKRVVKYQSKGPKLKLDLGFDCSWTHTQNAGYAKQIGQWIMTSIKNAVYYTPPVCPYQ